MNLAEKPRSCYHPVAQKLQSFFPDSSKFPSQAFKDFQSWAQSTTLGLVSCHLCLYQPSPHAPPWPTSTSYCIQSSSPSLFSQVTQGTWHLLLLFTPTLTVLIKSIVSELLNLKVLKISPLFVSLWYIGEEKPVIQLAQKAQAEGSWIWSQMS